MSIPVINIKLDTRQLDKIAAGLNKNTDQVLGILAFKVETEAKKIVRVDTGALRNSIHTEHIRELSWMVADGVEYGAYVEFPGRKRKWAGAPFMVPSAEKVGHELNSGALWRRLFE